MHFDSPLDARKIVRKVDRRFLKVFWKYEASVHDWQVLSPFRFYYDDKNPRRFVLVPGGRTEEEGAWQSDLASIPGFFGFVLQKDGVYSQGAVTHDWCYKNRGNVVFEDLLPGETINGLTYRRIEPLTREEQDLVFINAMKVLGTDRTTRFVMWRAVRRFGWIRYPKKS